MLDETQIKRLNELAAELELILKPIRLSDYDTPVNRGSEKEKSRTAQNTRKKYNPVFSYRDIPRDIEKPLIDYVKRLDPSNTPYEKLLYDDANFTLERIASLRTRRSSDISAQSIRLYGLPTRRIVSEAYSSLQSFKMNDKYREVGEVEAVEAQTHLKKALDRVGLSEWEVIITEKMQARMSVRSVEKQVKIRQDYKFTKQAIQRLLVHEIGTHVFRYSNGARQRLELLRLGLADYSMTEEGMATYHEQQYDLRDPIVARRYALRVIAAYKSLTSTFAEVMEELIEYCDFDEAFDIAIRAKRGFVNTAEYGSYVKDKVYFEGFIKVQEHLEQHPDDYTLLMSGKVSLAMLPMLRSLRSDGHITSPQYLPQKLVDF